LTGRRRRALGVEKRRCLGGEIRAGQSGGQKLDHQRERRAFGVAEREHGPAQGRIGVGGRPALLVQRPTVRDRLAFLLEGEDIAARHFGQRQVDDDRRPIRQRTRKGDRIGAEQPFRSAPRRDRRGRIGEQQRHETLFGEAFDRMAGGAAMVRAPDSRRRDAGSARGRRQGGDGGVQRRIGKTVGGVDRQDGWARLF
jgi:hypothetical protein